MYALLNVAFALLAGLLMTRIFSRWRLPDVTAFLVAGVLIGPFCLGRLGITGVGFAAYEDVERCEKDLVRPGMAARPGTAGAAAWPPLRRGLAARGHGLVLLPLSPWSAE